MFSSMNIETVAIYARVSTDEQADRKTIDAQLDFAKQFCALHKTPIYKIYKDDGISGTVPFAERPGGYELLEDAKNHKFKSVLVYKLDRLGRATRVILNTIHELEQLGIKLKSMTEPFDTADASGRFLLTILAGVADLERSNILERMNMGTERAAKDGKWLGGIVPYGYYKGDDKYLHINDEVIPQISMSEADVVRLMYKLAGNDGKTCVECADYLNSLNVPTHYNLHGHTGKRIKATDGIWRPNRVLNILRNTVYKGIHNYGKRTNKKRETIERKVPAIVDAELWQRAQDTIAKNTFFQIRNAKKQYLLRGLIQCENCGHHYHGTVRSLERGLMYYVCNGRTMYRAYGKEKCPSTTLNMQWLDNLVWQQCVDFIRSPEIVLQYIEEQDNEKIYNDLRAEQEQIERQLTTKAKEKDNIVTLYCQEFITMAEVEERIERIKKEVSTLNQRADEIEQLLQKQNDTFKNKETAADLLKSLNAILDKGDYDFETKQHIIRLLIEKIFVKTIISENGEKHATIRIKFNFTDDTHPSCRVDNRNAKDCLLLSKENEQDNSSYPLLWKYVLPRPLKVGVTFLKYNVQIQEAHPKTEHHYGSK